MLRRLLHGYKNWRERRKLKKMALRILADPSPSIDALIKGKAIMTALSERKPVCRNCFNIFEPKEREFAERFQMRSILMVPDSEPDPMLCDVCFTTTTSVYNRHWTNIGTNNSGHTNLILQKLH